MLNIFTSLVLALPMLASKPCPLPPPELRPGTWSPMQDYWRSTEIMWHHGFQIDSDTPPCFITDRNFHISLAIYDDIKSGDIVWIESRSLADFYRMIFPKIHVPIVLLVNGGDESFPAFYLHQFDVFRFINHKNIIHIFAQNCSIGNSHPKVTTIPIGIDFTTIATSPGPLEEFATPAMQEEELKHIISSLKPTDQRIPKAFVDFQLHDTLKGSLNGLDKIFGENRTEIFHKILPSGMVDYLTYKLRRRDLYKKRGEYAFTISPPGNGLDCFRTWEGLILGCIVIVKSSPLDCLYEGLPVVIVKDWSEINEANMQRWLEKYKDAFTNPAYKEKYTHKYWMNKMRAKAAPYKK